MNRSENGSLSKYSAIRTKGLLLEDKEDSVDELDVLDVVVDHVVGDETLFDRSAPCL